MTEFCVFFHDQKFHLYHVYYYHTDTYEETHEIPNKCDSFEHSRLTKQKIHERIKDNISMEILLKEYAENIYKWRNQLLTTKTLKKKFDFMANFKKSDGTKFLNTNESNILRFFKAYSSIKYTVDKFDKITWTEYNWYEKENLSSLMRCTPGIYNCLGFDFKMAYPNYLASQVYINNARQIFMFPTKKGKRFRIKTLKDNLYYGLYKVKMHSDNPDFNFVFNFNKENIYTHYEINFCRQHQQQYNITIELIIEDDYNCLVYKKYAESYKNYNDSDDIINGELIFKPWLDRITDLKKEFPDNGLIKLLSSSMWGFLSKSNKRHYNETELKLKPEIKYDYFDNDNINYLCLNEKDNIDGTVDFLLINKDMPYCKNYRLKPFIKAFERIIMARICLQIGVNKIVRINTDNITFNKDLLNEADIKNIESISPTFLLEEKTTGKFEIRNINNFVRLD